MSDNTLRLVVEADTSNANKGILAVNAGLSGIEKVAVRGANSASKALDSISSAAGFPIVDEERNRYDREKEQEAQAGRQLS